MSRYNKSEIMSLAWSFYKERKGKRSFDRNLNIYRRYSFSDALKLAWSCAKFVPCEKTYDYDASNYYANKQSGEYTGD